MLQSPLEHIPIFPTTAVIAFDVTYITVHPTAMTWFHTNYDLVSHQICIAGS